MIAWPIRTGPIVYRTSYEMCSVSRLRHRFSDRLDARIMTVRRAPKVRPKWIRQYRFSTNVQYLYKAQKVVYNVFLPSVDGTSLGSTANVIEIHSGGVFQPPYARLRTRHIQRLPSHCLPSTYQYIPVHTSYITHILTQAASAS